LLVVRGSIGQLLIQQGVIDASGLADALARQGGRHPVASELYNLGYATERQLTMALSAQTGWAGVVLDESTLRLDVLENVTPEWARRFSALVIHEDATTLVIAAARPEDAIVPARGAVQHAAIAVAQNRRPHGRMGNQAAGPPAKRPPRPGKPAACAGSSAASGHLNHRAVSPRSHPSPKSQTPPTAPSNRRTRRNDDPRGHNHQAHRLPAKAKRGGRGG
jgi:hypothetical protein